MTTTDRFLTLRDGRVLAHRIDEPVASPRRPETFVLLHGMGQDLLVWPASLVDALVDAGFRVVRVDLRDSGASSSATTPAPAPWRIAARRPRPDAYTVEDLADDVAELLDSLGHGQVHLPVHLVGLSMGAMVAQCLAAVRPDQVRSLASLLSSTGQPGVGGSSRAFTRLLVRPAPRGVEATVTRSLEFVRAMASEQFPADMAEERLRARAVHERAHVPGPAGALRHLQAIIASGDRTATCARISAATLVVHGDRDPVVDVSGGRASAAAIPGARLVVVPGMGHHLAPALREPLATLLVDHARSAHVPGAQVEVPPALARRPSPAPDDAAARRTWGARAVVTGAGSGIGRALALELVERGGQVVCADRDEASARDTARLADPEGAHAVAVRCDVADPAQVQALADASLAWFGMPTLVVNNAGLGAGRALVGETPDGTWERATAVNLMGVVHGCETFVPLLRRTAGPRGVLNVASAAGFAPAPGMGAYGVGKAGVIALTETLASEFVGTDLAATVTCPTFVETAIFDGELMDEASARAARDRAAASGVDATAVARSALDAHDRGLLHHFPQAEARRFWRLKRAFPARFPAWSARAADAAPGPRRPQRVRAVSAAHASRGRSPRAHAPSPAAALAPSLAQMTVGPVVLGVIAGLALGWAAPAYWIVQVLAMVLTVVGIQQPGARAAIVPSAIGGVTFGLSILAVRALSGWPDMADLGPEPLALPLITTVVGTLLGCVGGWRAGRA